MTDEEIEELSETIIYNFCESIGFLKSQYLTDRGIALTKSVLCKWRDSTKPIQNNIENLNWPSDKQIHKAAKEWEDMVRMELINSRTPLILGRMNWLFNDFVKGVDWLKAYMSQKVKNEL